MSPLNGRPLLSAILALVPAASALAQENKDAEIVADIRLPDGGGDGAALFPVERVLDALRQSKGYSFVFDSRLLFGKKIPVVEPSASLESDLSEVLKSARLRLHKVAPNSFAITEAGPEAEIIAVHAGIARTAAPPVDTILVVGTTATLSTTNGAKRIFSIDADDLAFLGAASPAEAIYDLPQSLASFTPSNTALFGAAAGMSLADLRGLNPRRTLVLMNGRRRTITSGGNGEIGGADLGAFAEPFLERIEVHNAPAGARFGGAAVAGTINFVTRSGIEGVETGGRFGISERGDSEAASLYAIAGRSFENFGNLTLGLAATRSEGLVGADREFSESFYGFALDGRRSTAPGAVFLPGFGQSSITERGLFAGAILADGTFARFPDRASYIPGDDGAVDRFVGSLDQIYNQRNTQSTILPNDQLTGIASFEANPSENFRYFLELNAGVSTHEVSLLPLPATRGRGVDPAAGDAAVIPLDNPTLPQSIRDIAQASFGTNAVSLVFEHRYAELGPRLSDIDRRSYDVATGLEFKDDTGRTFSVSYRYGRNKVGTRDNPRIDAGRLRTALDATQCAGVPGCAPVDFFAAPEISPDALAFIVTPELLRTLTISEHEITAAGAIDLDFGDGKEGRVAAGAEYRTTSFSDRDLTPPVSLPISYFRGENLDARLQTIDAYAQFEANLIRSSGFPGELDGSMALRVTESPQHESVFNFEASVEWRPAPGVALFSRRHFGERAPDIIERFSLGPNFELAFVDPCGLNPSAQSEAVKANCASTGPLGAGPDFIQTQTLATATIYGNPALRAERASSAVYGVTFSPGDWIGSLPGRLELTAAWYDFQISNAVSAEESPIAACFASPGFSSPACGVNPRTGLPSIIRDPVTRQIEAFDFVLRNGAAFEWRGLDLELRYAGEPAFLPFANLVWFSALHTYTDRVVSDSGTQSLQRLEGLIDYPRHRTLATLGVETGDLTFVVYANRRGKALTIRSDAPEARIPSAFYLDLTARLDLSDQAYVQAGVQNLTDLEPAITAYNDVGNFAAEFYDPIGRRYFVSFRARF